MKKRSPKKYLDLNFDNFKWCIENDYQVYVKPLGEWFKNTKGEDEFFMNGQYKIATRRNGIKCLGKDFHYDSKGNKFNSTETLSEKTFKKEEDAFNDMVFVRKFLREKYG